MPYVKDDQVDRLTLPSDPAYWVDMKRRASFGDISAAQKATFEITSAEAVRLNGKRSRPTFVDQRSGMGADLDMGAFLPTLVARLIVNWNLDDSSGKLDITLKNLESLDAEDGDFLQLEAQKRMAGRSRAEQEDFTTPSSESSPLGAGSPTTPTLTDS